MLIGNRSVLHKSPGRFLAGTVASTDRSGWCEPGMMRSADYPALAGLPNGYYQASWFLPKSAGALSSAYNARIALEPAGLAVGGITADAPATITFTVADATGELISSGEGAAVITFSTNTPLLTASLNAIGSASFAITASAPLGAEASAEGQAAMTFSMAATILPASDAPPARTASASFSITGVITPYALGHLSGTTVDAGILTVDTIAAAVLAAALTTPIAANIRQVNSTTVQGTGVLGDEWGP